MNVVFNFIKMFLPAKINDRISLIGSGTLNFFTKFKGVTPTATPPVETLTTDQI